MCENNILYGAPQRCPKCMMENVSGLKLPQACVHCKGTGKVDLGLKLTNKAAEPGVCFCRFTDPWRCAVDQGLSTLICDCQCHRKP